VNRRGSGGPGIKFVALAFPRYQTGSTQVLVPEAYGDELAGTAHVPGELTHFQGLHLGYWTAFFESLGRRGSAVKFGKPPSSSIATSRISPGGFVYRAWNRMIDDRSGVEVIPRQARAMDRFSALDRAHASERLRHLGDAAVRDEPPPPLIWVERVGDAGMPSDPEQWPALIDWMADALDELRRIVEPIGEDG